MARRRTVEADRILRAAAELLAARAPEKVTIAAVAAAAGVSTGTVYNYFRNKEHLLAAAAGVPGARSAWEDPAPGQDRQAYLRSLAALALSRFRLVAGKAPDPTLVLAREVESLASRLSGFLRSDGRGGSLAARVFYGAAAAAVLLGWERDVDGEIAGILARLVETE